MQEEVDEVKIQCEAALKRNLLCAITISILGDSDESLLYLLGMVGCQADKDKDNDIVQNY